MKPALEEIIGKDGSVSVRFNPTGHMILFANAKAKAQDEPDPEVARRAGVNPQAPATWCRKYGQNYLTWLEEFMESASFSKEAEILEAVGMVHAAQGSYSFWRDMAKKHGVIADEVKEVRVTINTNFDSILAQGESLDDARRRILQQVRGLGDQGKSRVVDITPPKDAGSLESSGSRASDLQSQPLALPDPLGSDGGRAERGGAIPAVSESDPPSGLDRVLAKRAVPTRPKK